MNNDSRYRDIVEGLPQTVYEIDPTGRVTYTNPRGFELTGYSSEDLEAGIDAVDLFAPESRQAVADNIRQILEAGEIGPNEHVLLTKGGKRIPVLVYSRFVLEDGKPVGLRGVMLDLSERNRIVADLRESEERYRHLVDQALVGIVVHSGGRLLYANEHALQLLGATSAKEVVGHSILRFIHPDSRLTVKNRVRAIYDKTAPAPPMEEKFLRIDGTPIEVEVAGSMVDYRGKPAAQVVFRDIGYRKKAERVLLSIARGVSASVGHSFFRELVLHLADALEADYAFIGTPTEGETARIRTEAACADGEIVENFEYDLEGTPCEVVVGRQACRIPESAQIEYPEDLLLQEMGVHGYVGAPLIGSDGAMLGIIVVLYRQPVPAEHFVESMLDIFAARAVSEMERMRSEDERVALEAQLFQSQKTESLGRLAGGVAHDINNLITPILGYAELIEEELPEGSELGRQARAINQTATRAKGIIEQLLAFGRRQTLAVSTVRMGDLLDNLRDLLDRTVREDIDLRIAADSDEWMVRVDEVRIEQVIVNLVVNAQDAMPSGGRLGIEVANKTGPGAPGEDLPPGEWVVMTVRDSGVGMDDETRAKVFEPFFTTKEKGRGTGLGLATAMGIVKQHDGNILFDSQPGVGSSFSVLIPRWVGDLDPVPADSGTVAVSSSGETVLVVEDDASVRDLVVAVLERRGYKVHAAADPAECIELVDRLPPASIDILLTDVVMPVMNGKQLFEKLTEKIAGLKVLYMSGYTEDILGPRGVIGSDVNFLQKPFSGSRLTAKIAEIIAAQPG